MPLVTCPDCGNAISDAAPACIHCGRPASAGPPAASPAAPTPVTAPVTAPAPPGAALRCPACGSDDVRRLSVVHADGLSTVSTLGSATVRTHGDRHDQHDHTDRESINTVTTVQSSASLQAAPPARKSPWLLGCAAVATMLVAGIVLAAIGSLPGFLLGTVATGWLFWGRVRNAHRWNQEEYPALLAKWQRTFRCDRCGARFEANLPATVDP